MSVLMPVAIAVPLIIGLAMILSGPPRRIGLGLVPIASLPAAAVALLGRTGDRVELDWVLLGSIFRIDELTSVFLAFGVIIWTAAALYGHRFHRDDPKRHRVQAFFLLGMAGSFALTLAGDVVTFYAGFALMTFTAYGLVVHDRSDPAWWAGKVYVAFVVLGEALLVGAFWLAAMAAGSTALSEIPAGIAEGPWTTLTVVLLLVGFGTKVGLLGLHVWMPLAYSAAPAPSSTVISGVMINAGLLGWLVFLPLGEAAIGWAAAALITLGLAGVFLAVAVGVFQSDPKVNLAYSSVSQMGLMIATVGVGLGDPAVAALAIAAVALYALQHGLVKAALFMAVDMVTRSAGSTRTAVFIGVGLLSATLAAAPFTAGWVAKYRLGEAAELGTYSPALITFLITLSSAATVLLLGRLVLILIRSSRVGEIGVPNTGRESAKGLAAQDSSAPGRGPVTPGVRPPLGLLLPWLTLSAIALVGAWVALVILPLDPLELSITASWSSLWPVLLGLLLLGAGATMKRDRLRRIQRVIRPGDILTPELRLLAAFRKRTAPTVAATVSTVAGTVRFTLQSPGSVITRIRFETVDSYLQRWEIAGLAVLVVALILVVSVW